jgi:hypothetical protein
MNYLEKEDVGSYCTSIGIVRLIAAHLQLVLILLNESDRQACSFRL